MCFCGTPEPPLFDGLSLAIVLILPEGEIVGHCKVTLACSYLGRFTHFPTDRKFYVEGVITQLEGEQSLELFAAGGL
jgi:hypothetical protein